MKYIRSLGFNKIKARILSRETFDGRNLFNKNCTEIY